MGKEIREVPEGWEHFKDDMGKYIPIRKSAMPKKPRNAMPFFVMYDNDEDIPISPVFSNKKPLKQWLKLNGISPKETVRSGGKRVKTAITKIIERINPPGETIIEKPVVIGKVIVDAAPKKKNLARRIIEKLKFWS